ncbi:MAG: hypothetical protein FGM36_15875, partial [Burkholderiaceae bacterium]|nr:hypothetical protein [Burkholderiaceae bacterium]
MSACSDLPNAQHIDWVVESLKTHPEMWGRTWLAVYDEDRNEAQCEAWHAAYYAAYTAAWDPARGAAMWSAAWYAAWDAAWYAAWVATRDSAWYAAQGAILALVAYDDCDQYLDMTSEELKVWALLTEHPAAVLLLPLV